MTEPTATLNASVLKALESMRRLGYIGGYLEALWSYSWWKDGIAYVGTTGRTYREAALSFLSEQEAAEPGSNVAAAIAELRAGLHERVPS